MDNQQGENRGNRIKVIIVIIVEKRPYIKWVRKLTIIEIWWGIILEEVRGEINRDT